MNIMRIFVSAFLIIVFVAGCKAEPPQVVETIPRLVTKKTPFFKVFCYQDGSIKLNEKRYSSLALFEVAYIQETRSNSVVWLSGEEPKPGSPAPDLNKPDKATKEGHDLWDFLVAHSKPGTEFRAAGRSDFSDLVEEQKMLRAAVERTNKSLQ